MVLLEEGGGEHISGLTGQQVEPNIQLLTLLTHLLHTLCPSSQLGSVSKGRKEKKLEGKTLQVINRHERLTYFVTGSLFYIFLKYRTICLEFNENIAASPTVKCKLIVSSLTTEKRLRTVQRRRSQ